jgi:hypothetical protein
MANDLTGWTPSFGGRLTHGAVTETGREAPTHFGGDPKLVASEQAAYRTAVDRTVPHTVIAEWADDPAGEEFRLRTALSTIEPIRHIEAATRQEIGRQYEHLSPSVQAAIWRELGWGSPGSARTLPDKVIEQMWDTREGAMLRPIFGYGLNADRKLSLVVERIRRLREDLTAWEDNEFESFVNGLSAHALSCCLAALAH